MASAPRGETPGWQTLLGMGAVIAAVLVVGMGLGWLIDTLLNTFPIFVMVGLAAGIVGAGGYTVATFRKFLHS